MSSFCWASLACIRSVIRCNLNVPNLHNNVSYCTCSFLCLWTSVASLSLWSRRALVYGHDGEKWRKSKGKTKQGKVMAKPDLSLCITFNKLCNFLLVKSHKLFLNKWRQNRIRHEHNVVANSNNKPLVFWTSELLLWAYLFVFATLPPLICNSYRIRVRVWRSVWVGVRAKVLPY